mmetsp:Transcript_20467/g.40951  ORF Transcript_20467/g.40951 Transcript_20467/m.40951 type:complete len:420 (+) Transcript_20467:180-1439(+)
MDSRPHHTLLLRLGGLRFRVVDAAEEGEVGRAGGDEAGRKEGRHRTAAAPRRPRPARRRPVGPHHPGLDVRGRRRDRPAAAPRHAAPRHAAPPVLPLPRRRPRPGGEPVLRGGHAGSGRGELPVGVPDDAPRDPGRAAERGTEPRGGPHHGVLRGGVRRPVVQRGGGPVQLAVRRAAPRARGPGGHPAGAAADRGARVRVRRADRPHELRGAHVVLLEPLSRRGRRRAGQSAPAAAPQVPGGPLRPGDVPAVRKRPLRHQPQRREELAAAVRAGAHLHLHAALRQLRPHLQRRTHGQPADTRLLHGAVLRTDHADDGGLRRHRAHHLHRTLRGGRHHPRRRGHRAHPGGQPRGGAAGLRAGDERRKRPAGQAGRPARGVQPRSGLLRDGRGADRDADGGGADVGAVGLRAADEREEDQP